MLDIQCVGSKDLLAQGNPRSYIPSQSNVMMRSGLHSAFSSREAKLIAVMQPKSSPPLHTNLPHPFLQSNNLCCVCWRIIHLLPISTCVISSEILLLILLEAFTRLFHPWLSSLTVLMNVVTRISHCCSLKYWLKELIIFHSGFSLQVGL